MAAGKLPSPSVLRNYGYKSKFSHERETAKPHFYNVMLDTWNIFAEPKVIYFYVRYAL